MSDDPDNVVLRHLRDIRREMRDHRTLLAGLVDQGQRLERRMGELDRRMGEIKDDIELMLKAELMARMGNFESRFEARLEALESQTGDAP